MSAHKCFNFNIFFTKRNSQVTHLVTVLERWRQYCYTVYSVKFEYINCVKKVEQETYWRTKCIYTTQTNSMNDMSRISQVTLFPQTISTQCSCCFTLLTKYFNKYHLNNQPISFPPLVVSIKRTLCSSKGFLNTLSV